MDPDTKVLLGQIQSKYKDRIKGAKILEIGSQYLNGSCRPFFEGCGEYVGIDIVEGKEVDIVLSDHYKYPFEDKSFDLIVTANCLEHCTRPWETMKEAFRVLRDGGLIFVTVPWQFMVHKDGKCNTDCYRILEDGMIALFDYAGFKTVETRTYKQFTKGVGRKV